MANLSKLFNPYKDVDPYPTFAIWGGSPAGNPGWSIVDSEMSHISNGIVYTGTEGWNTNSSYTGTDGLVSSNSTSYAVAYSSANQAEGNLYVDPSVNTKQGSPFRVATTSFSGFWANFGTVIGEEGVRQKISIAQVDNEIYTHLRGGPVLETVNLNSLRNTSGEGGSLGRGQISYNDRTGTLVVLMSASSSVSYRAHVYTNTKRKLNTALISSHNLRAFIGEAYAGTNGASYYYNDFTWTTTGATGSADAWRRMRVTLGDNSILGLFRYTPNQGAYWSYVTLNPAGTTATVTDINNSAVTTTYGWASGANYGAKTNITWDNKWTFSSCQYYYYGAGMIGVWFYTPDPTKSFFYVNQSSSAGMAMLPFQASKWVYSTQVNSNSGNLMQLSIFDPEGIRQNGLSPTGGGPIANAADITSQTQATNFNFDVPYSSTYYPCIVAMSQWSTKV